ncbi:dimethylaniline monooxygenase [N-oxide-forming] 5-like [Rhinatrema bivittatum]|uniref:dimethylaniline monooxygenase [N-oxide-forming] 5-like n=1 Tax=Rhinatrema bivittatum TaxID=194408 RepID=UPI00112D4305|nr:dimethylaniline monooxygenase [N-oxide-forming] 5-like [Rhinatrema bivittatum]
MWSLGQKPLDSLQENPANQTVNDDLPNRILFWQSAGKAKREDVHGNCRIFEDGTMEENIDVVIFATGYSFSFPFFEDPAFKVHNNKIPLYKQVFPLDLEKATVAFIGLVQPLGPFIPIAEIQARWATRVLKGLSKLPSAKDMKADIALTRQEMEKRYVDSPRHTLQVDFIEYLDELAIQIDVKPNLLSLLLTDPKLAKEVFFGPCTPYQYRLRGPGKWEGARQAILTQRDRIIKPTKTRQLDNKTMEQSSSIPLLLKVLALLCCSFPIFLIIRLLRRKRNMLKFN